MVQLLIRGHEGPKVTGKPALCTCLLLGAVMASTGCSRLDNAIKCRSADPDTRIAACTALIQSGQVWTTTKLSTVYNNRGTAYMSKGDHDHAIQDFSDAIRLDPRFALAYNNRGAAWVDKKDYDRAIPDYNEAIRLNPKIAAAFYGRGEAYDHKGDFDRAIQDHSEAIRLNPNFAYAYDARGRAHRNKGEFDSAIQDYTDAIRLDPTFALAWNNRGDAYRSKGDYDRAIKDFNEALRLNPNLMSAWGNRCGVYLLQSNLIAAIADFKHMTSVAPSSNSTVIAALMLHIAIKQQGQDDAQLLAPVASAADLSKWPGPMLKLDRGQMTAAEVMAAAANPDADRQKWQLCEANYFTGEDALIHHQRTTALARLNAARDGCPKGDGAYSAALVELKRLGAPAPPAK